MTILSANNKTYAIKMPKLNYTENVEAFIKGINKPKMYQWKMLPNTIQSKLYHAWKEMKFEKTHGNIEAKTFHIEHHTPKKISNSGNFSIHTNNAAYPNVKMTMLYYYGIQGIYSELIFYKKLSRKKFVEKIMNSMYPKYDKIGSLNIFQHNVISFNSKTLHQPHTKVLNSSPKRNVLAIFVAN